MQAVVAVARPARPRSAVVRGSAAAAVAMLLFVAALLLVRRWVGGPTRPLPAALLILAAVLLSTVSAAARAAWRTDTERTASVGGGAWRFWLPSLALALWGVALSLPGSSPVGVTGLWAILVGHEGLAALLRRRRRGAAALVRPRPPQAVAERPPAAADATPGGLPADVWQQVIRTLDPGGGETVRGLLRSRFQPGQVVAVLHVAFCPPLESLPDFHVETSLGDAVRVHVAQSMHYGARIELQRIGGTRQSAEAVVQFTARVKARTPGGAVE